MLNEMVLCEEHSQRRRIRRLLAHSQQTFPTLAAALLLPLNRVRAERGRGGVYKCRPTGRAAEKKSAIKNT